MFRLKRKIESKRTYAYVKITVLRLWIKVIYIMFLLNIQSDLMNFLIALSYSNLHLQNNTTF